MQAPLKGEIHKRETQHSGRKLLHCTILFRSTSKSVHQSTGGLTREVNFHLLFSACCSGATSARGAIIVAQVGHNRKCTVVMLQRKGVEHVVFLFTFVHPRFFAYPPDSLTFSHLKTSNTICRITSCILRMEDIHLIFVFHPCSSSPAGTRSHVVFALCTRSRLSPAIPRMCISFPQ